jgi:hypothetical protein
MSLPFRELERTEKHHYKVTPMFFNDDQIVWLQVDESHWNTVLLSNNDPDRYKGTLQRRREGRSEPEEDRHYNNQNQEKRWGICVSAPFYKKMVEKHGTDPSWIIDHWNTDGNYVFAAVTQKHMDRYLTGLRETTKETYLNTDPKTQDVLATLQADDYHLIVREDGNWTFWDYLGNPVIRKFIPDDLDNPFKSGSYKLHELAEHMRMIPGVGDVEIHMCDRYSSEDKNEKTIGFSYKPQDTDSMLSLCLESGFGRRAKYIELFGAKQFEILKGR